MAREKKIDRLYEYDQTLASKNVLLAKVLDALALEGVIRPDAVPLILQMRAKDCVVVDGEISLDATDMETAVRRMAVRMPLLAPPADYVNPDKERRERLMEEAKQGSVQSLGYLYKDFVQRLGERAGEAAFKQWQADQGVVKIGKSATGINAANEAALKAAEGDDGNLFRKLRTPDGAIDRTVEAAIGAYTEAHGFAATKKMADEAGVGLSGLPLRRFGT